MGKREQLRSPTKAQRFPYHPQQDEMACGVACLRMIQEWLDSSAESEPTWAERAGCHDRGLTPTRLLRQLKRLGGDRATVREIDAKEWSGLPDDWREGTAYVVLIDWFYEGTRGPANEGHYVVVHRFRRGTRFGGGRVPVAVIQDPSSGPDPQFWSWGALLAMETHRIFEVCRVEE